jgi:hypothetical protein
VKFQEAVVEARKNNFKQPRIKRKRWTNSAYKLGGAYNNRVFSEQTNEEVSAQDLGFDMMNNEDDWVVEYSLTIKENKMTANYVVFPTLGNKVLADLLIARALELGYSEPGYREGCIKNSVSLDLSGGEINHTYNCRKMLEGEVMENHVLGNFYGLMFTDKYKVVRPIKVVLNNEYTAEVTPNGVKVGCQVFTHQKVDELMKAVNECRKDK